MIVDLGQSDRKTPHGAADAAVTMLDQMRACGFSGVVAVSMIHETTRVAVWPDDTVDAVVRRWTEERAKEARQPTPVGYVGKRRKTE